jgi:small subunit ribosomal protein S2
MPYVSQRWLGGMLTNFKTIRQSIKRLRDLEEITEAGASTEYTKKELLGLSRERDKLQRGLGGIKQMDNLPDAVFIIDVGHEEIAVKEAGKLNIPVVAVVDTNCSPEGIDYPIPGNDDAMRAIQLYAAGIADAVLEGKSSIPEVPTGDDEFVELDEEGKPKVEAKQAKKPPTKKRGRVTKIRSKGGRPKSSDDGADDGADTDGEDSEQ